MGGIMRYLLFLLFISILLSFTFASNINLNCTIIKDVNINLICNWDDLNVNSYKVKIADNNFLKHCNSSSGGSSGGGGSATSYMSGGNCITYTTKYNYFTTIDFDTNNNFFKYNLKKIRENSIYVGIKDANDSNNCNWLEVKKIDLNNIILYSFFRINTKKPLFKWIIDNNYQKYVVEVAEDINFRNKIYISPEIPTNNFQIPINLEVGKIYFWHVKGIDLNNNQTGLSLIDSFIIVPPNNGNFKDDSESNHQKTKTIKIDNYCDTGNKVQIQISQNSLFQNLDYNVLYDLNNYSNWYSGKYIFDLNVGCYIFRYRFFENNYYGDWINVNSICIFEPINPEIIYPKNDINILNPVFKWSSETKDVNFLFEISKQQNTFECRFLDVNRYYTIDLNLKLDYNLENNAKYCFRIKAIKGNAESDFVSNSFNVNFEDNNSNSENNSESEDESQTYSFYLHLHKNRWQYFFLPRIVLQDINSLDNNYSVLNVLSSLKDKQFMLYYFDSKENKWLSYKSNRPINDLNEFIDNENKPYWIKIYYESGDIKIK